MNIDLQHLTERAITLYTRKPGAQQPAADLSGAAMAGGLDYIVLRNICGVLAVFRVMTHSHTLKRLRRWPKAVE